MSGYLLDTNVISELSKESPDSGVTAFLSGSDDLWLSSVLIHEVEYGLRLLPHGRRRNRLAAMQSAILEIYADRILPLDRAVAERAAQLRAQARLTGRTVDVGDVLIAGIAKAHDLAIATRNVGDFEHLGVQVVNPWEAP